MTWRCILPLQDRGLLQVNPEGELYLCPDPATGLSAHVRDGQFGSMLPGGFYPEVTKVPLSFPVAAVYFVQLEPTVEYFTLEYVSLSGDRYNHRFELL